MTFSRSLRSLESDSYRPSLLILVCALLLITVWGGWFLAARVPVYEVSLRARVEAAESANLQGLEARLAALDSPAEIVLQHGLGALDPVNLRLAVECARRRAKTLPVVAHP